ncbi:MAG: MBL fold metallo-hydrolase [Gemmatimonadota bacterium]
MPEIPAFDLSTLFFHAPLRAGEYRLLHSQPTRAFICTACGTQFEHTFSPARSCPVCEDERQFVPVGGQSWTTIEELRGSHRNEIRELEPGRLWGIGTTPEFGIGQRALLLRTRNGNLLWDCLSLVDDETAGQIAALGGIDAIAISHPHFYGSMVEWSRTFGGAPIYLHAADRDWVRRSHDTIVFWDGDVYDLAPELTLVRTGGHFPGAQCLHWSSGADGRGALLSGDQPSVCLDRRHVTFMYSYPNFLPLGPEAVRHTRDVLAPFEFDRVYGAWWDRVIPDAGSEAVALSADRFLSAIGCPDP